MTPFLASRFHLPARSLVPTACVLAATLVAGCAAENRTRVVRASAEKRQIQARQAQETATGLCSPEHQEEMAKALAKLNAVMTERSEFASFVSTGSQILVAKEAGVSVALDAGLGGDYHVFAYGYGPLAIVAEDARGNMVGSPSDRAAIATVVGGVPASVWIPRARGSYIVTVTGKGCALVATYRRLY